MGLEVSINISSELIKDIFDIVLDDIENSIIINKDEYIKGKVKEIQDSTKWQLSSE